MSWLALWMSVFALCESVAHADLSRKPKKRKGSVTATLGVRYWMHYNRVTNISTPPEVILGELQINYWLNSVFGVQFSGSTAVSISQGMYFGAGLRLNALTISSSKAAVIGGISLILLGDVVYYNVTEPIPPQSYTANGILFRYGASVNWLFGSGKVFLDTTMAVSVFQNNFFIGPFVGLGLRF